MDYESGKINTAVQPYPHRHCSCIEIVRGSRPLDSTENWNREWPGYVAKPPQEQKHNFMIPRPMILSPPYTRDTAV